MRIFSIILAVTMALVLSGCSSKFKTYRGPEVTQILVYKSMIGRSKAIISILASSPKGTSSSKGMARRPKGPIGLTAVIRTANSTCRSG